MYALAVTVGRGVVFACEERDVVVFAVNGLSVMVWMMRACRGL
jgi:hypothetical protein